MTYDKNNVFAKILRGEIPCKEVYQDEFVLAFHDISPAAPTHILVIPKGEYISFDDFVRKTSPEQSAKFFATVQKIAANIGVDKTGYRLIANHGGNASQAVPHFHVHILGGRQLGGLVQGDRSHR